MTAGERGAGSVFALVVMMTVMLAVAGVLQLAGAHQARRHAAAAADLAALAAAHETSTGSERACATAARVATANRAQLRDCQVDGAHVEVLVEVRAQGLAWLPSVRRRARAGP